MRLSPLVCCAIGAIVTATPADPLVLVRDGEPVSSIIIAERPTRAARFAAEELQLHLRKVTGATVPIMPDTSAVDGTAILIGDSLRTRALGLQAQDFAEQEYLIRFEDDALVLMGRDHPGDLDGYDGPQPVEGRFGMARLFDGQSDALVIADPGFSDDQGSLEAWVYLPAEVQPGESTILRLDGANPWTYHIIRRWPNSSSLGYSTYDGEVVRNVSSGELAEGWHHVLATYDAASGRAELYVDGILQGGAEYVRTTCAGTALNIGGMGEGQMGVNRVGNPFAGRIDEVRVSTVVRQPMIDEAPEADGGTQLLMRFDEADGPALDSSGQGRAKLPLPGWYEERGTLNATYDFLERFCGVRWYMPTDVGTVYPNTPTLTLEGEGIRRAPAMRYRWITPTPLYLPTRDDRVPGADVDLWRLRMRLGGEPFWVCHSFGGYPDRFLADHPDWFAQGHEGAPTQLCYTNEELIAQVAQDARDYFDGKGDYQGATNLGDVFGIVPMDDNRFCQCERCQAQLDTAEADNPQFSNGRWSRYIWNFVNDVAREVRKTHPDKWIGALAYWDYAYYPEGIELEPNIVVQTCLHTRNWFCPSMERNDLRVLNGWVEHEGGKRPMYLWLYYNFPALQSHYGGYNSFPSYFAHTAMRQMELYRAAGMRGIFIEHSSEFGESHLMDVPDLYITLKLADDPELDGDEVLDEFFRLFYGTASEPMREAYMLIENAYGDPMNYPDDVRNSPGHQHQTEELAWAYLGTQERLDSLVELVDQARALASTELERQRVELFAVGIVDTMLEGKRAFDRRPADPGDNGA